MAGVPIKQKKNKRGSEPRGKPLVPKAGFGPGRAFKHGGKKRTKSK